MENTAYVTFDMDEASQNSFYEGIQGPCMALCCSVFQFYFLPITFLFCGFSNTFVHYINSSIFFLLKKGLLKSSFLIIQEQNSTTSKYFGS